ncbi:MAG: flagellar protein [Candidatus Marinimicrobia bacterium]|nr:flagellar protein [Candidatus Neomarinimicrobiota bacterium]
MSDSGIIERIAASNLTRKVSSIGNQLNKPKLPIDKPEGIESFSNVLRREVDLKFSSHAINRLKDRQIILDPSEMQRLKNAVNIADLKGSKDALVLLNNNAFIVSVNNRTVVTALNNDENKGRVFTNIDSAIIA